MRREQVDEHVIRQALKVAIQKVEGVRGERRARDEGVVRLVNKSVDRRMVQATMDPVDARVGEDQEQGDTEDGIAPTVVIDVVVQARISICASKRDKTFANY
jgi:hypothetical protein